MMQNTAQKDDTAKKRQVLVVEDDAGLMRNLVTIFEQYSDTLQVIYAKDAGEAVSKINPENPSLPHALVLDIMMPYGDANDLLDPENTEQHENDTGLRILKWCREQENKTGQQIRWVAIITARTPFAVDQEAKKMLEARGRIYYKPFDIFEMEHQLVTTLGIESKVPPALRPPSSITGQEVQ